MDRIASLECSVRCRLLTPSAMAAAEQGLNPEGAIKLKTFEQAPKGDTKQHPHRQSILPSSGSPHLQESKTPSFGASG